MAGRSFSFIAEVQLIPASEDLGQQGSQWLSYRVDIRLHRPLVNFSMLAKLHSLDILNMTAELRFLERLISDGFDSG